MIILRKNRKFSVGRMNLLVNVGLYGVCLVLFQVETVVYSLIYAAVNAIVLDRIHIQNINVSVKIVVKITSGEMEQEIIRELGRGITEWSAEGVYTKDAVRVLNIIMSKYEIHRLHVIVQKHDPHAFVVVNEGVQAQGNYRMKL